MKENKLKVLKVRVRPGASKSAKGIAKTKRKTKSKLDGPVLYMILSHSIYIKFNT